MSPAANCPLQPISSSPRSILVFRALQVGDMLCAVPALRALRARFPAAHILLAGLPWAAGFAGRFDRYIDEFIRFPGHPALPEQTPDAEGLTAFLHSISQRNIDLALQMHGDGSSSNAILAHFGARRLAGFIRSAASPTTDGCFLPYPAQGHEIERLLSLAAFVGAKSRDTTLEFPLTHEDHQELSLQTFATELKSKRYVCLHVGARHRNKCWPAACFSAMGDQLSRECGLRVVLTGSAAEYALAADVAARMHEPAINAACDMSLGALAALIASARLLICNDTAVSHIAAALRLPSVVIFVNSDSERWAPLDHERHRCVHDPDGQQSAEVLALVLAHAKNLLMKQAASVRMPVPAPHPR